MLGAPLNLAEHLIGVRSELYDKTNPDWVPSLNMGHQYMEGAGRKGVQRHERTKKRAKRRCEGKKTQVQTVDLYAKPSHIVWQPL